jgi:hypothetical protein
LTFTNIGADVFPQATETILNMADAMGTDLKTQAIQVGKALNDPILGVTALRRVGVQLSDQQQQLVKDFVKTGNISKAQAVILGELETQFGGVARASAKTLGGALQQLSNIAGDAFERIGGKLTPSLNELAIALTGASKDGGTFAVVFDTIAIALQKVIQFITIIVKSFNLVGVALDELKNIAVDVKNVLSGNFEPATRDSARLNKAIDSLSKSQDAFTTFSENASEAAESVGDKGAKGLEKLKKELEKLKKSIKDAEERAKNLTAGLQTLAQAGDFGAQLALQQQQFAQQLSTVRKAGLDTTALIKFQEQQKLSLIRSSIEQAANLENASFEERLANVQSQSAMILENDKLTNEQRLEVQRAYTEQSKALEYQRMQAFANSVQNFGRIGGETVSIFENLAQVQNNLGAQEIARMEEQGATQEQIEAKRRQLARKQAQDQKKFGRFSILIDTATAIASALTVKPFPLGLTLAGLAAAKGATQLAVNESTPIPAAQFGGTFKVPPGNQADSGLVRVNQGEEVNVAPVRTSGEGGPKTIIVRIGEKEFNAFMVDSMNTNLNNGKVQIRRSGVVKTA